MDALHDFVSLFFPRYCLGCSGSLVRGEEIICTKCIADFPRTDYHSFAGNPLEKRLTGRLPIRNAWAFLKFRKEGIVQQMLHQLKYNNHPEVGIALGKIFGYELSNAGFSSDFDLIVPVPLHETRRRKRGYNQSSTFAEGLSHSLGVPWSETVALRMRRTGTQTRKSKAERWENVKDVFTVSSEAIAQKRILLVDDLITTGATVEACGRKIVDSGCESLSIACIAEAQ
jgi:ComF family protein